MTEIIWKQENNDWTAKVGDYRLSVERVYGVYSASVMKRVNLDVVFIQHYFLTPEQAKDAAIQAFNNHVNK